MVLELRAPEETTIEGLRPLIPVFLSYVLSFVFVGIYWNNHHHLLKLVHRVNGRILWANLHLLFWISLTPFVTSWMGEHNFAAWPVAIYGVVLLCAAIAYYILALSLLKNHGKDSAIANALGKDFKGKISIVIYLFAIPLAFVHSLIACALYVVVVIMWLVPDRRIERMIERDH